ncbi:hypothetical protein Sste5346_000716 [Sporothrix stenoceras]|uniref:tripeptidyl-peptidase II n=1 Tax=Sporothrix stenoceras TaxID=5173 RepID=A0ABR3ZRU8_9PEZI
MQIPSVKCLAAFGILFTSFTDAAAVQPRPRNDLVRHEWHEPRHVEGWQRRERLVPAADDLLPMRIGFTQSETVVDKAHNMLMERADPVSPLYGQHLTPEEVADLFAPADKAVEAVKRWVVESGGIAADRVSLSTNRQWLQFDARVDEAEQLLQAEYYNYEHTESGVNLTACPQYHVPAPLQKHIDYITPGVKLASHGFEERVKAVRRRDDKRGNGGARLERRSEDASQTEAASAPWVTGGCDQFATYECIRAQYGLPSSKTKIAPVAGNEVGIFETANNHYSKDDLNLLYSYTAPEIPKGSYPETRAINGAPGPSATQDKAGGEADFDIEIAMPLVWPQKTVVFDVDDDYYQNAVATNSGGIRGIFNTLFDAIDGSYCTLDAFGYSGNCQDDNCRDPVYPDPNPGNNSYQGQLMCGTIKPTNVISISFVRSENSPPSNYLRRQCLEIMKLGLQGVTVVVASGDSGVGSIGKCMGSDHSTFLPQFPASCPYALTVGATMLVPTAANKSVFVETATSDYSSGGGFSNLFPAQDYQQSAITNYLSKANLAFASSSVFNKSGRAYPDVSGLGENFYGIWQGNLAKVGGTSVSTPLWAAVITQLNEARLRADKSTVGFVNPALYLHPEVFNDVTVGSNPGCGSTGFVATAGWDPVSGLGSPNFPKMRDMFLSLP